MGRTARQGEAFGRYVLEERLGSGAMGVVWRAQDSVLDRPVALKLLGDSLGEDEEFRTRFLREASTLARLDSPHIISVFDHGEVDGQLFLVTQLVTGGDLGQRLERRGPLSGSEAVSLVAQLAGALSDAHASGVVHRDVKPSNVLLRGEREGRSELFGYLCDFGIAQTGDDGGTRTGMVVGTWGYLAPERARGEAATAASDVYSLGCVLWAAVTGHAPYAGTEVQVAMAHQSEPVPQLAADGSAMVDGLNRVIARAMAKEPSDRHHSAADLLADLRRVETEATRGSSVEHTVLRPVTAAPVAEDTVLRPRTASGAAPVVATGPTVTPVVTAAPPGRRTAVIVAAALVAVVLLAGSAVALLLSQGRDPEPQSPRQAAASAPASASATPTPTPTATAACWNGTTAATRSACTPVRGVAGMRWLFPSYAASRNCRPDKVYDGKVRALGCEVTLPNGEGARLVYSEWGSNQLAVSHYRRKYGQFSSRAGGVEAWPAKLVTSSRTWQTSRYVEGLPYSVTIASGSRETTRAAVRLLRIRSQSERQGLR